MKIQFIVSTVALIVTQCAAMPAAISKNQKSITDTAQEGVSATNVDSTSTSEETVASSSRTAVSSVESSAIATSEVCTATGTTGTGTETASSESSTPSSSSVSSTASVTLNPNNASNNTNNASSTNNNSTQEKIKGVDKLWKGIKVSTAATTDFGEPTDTPTLNTPPNMPSYHGTYRLPANFLWGVASSAYQIEGAVKDDNRGPSIWDVAYHKADDITSDGTNADVATNHYYLYKQDAKRLQALGIPHYSMSISWPRIFPFGNGTANEAGLKHYEDEVDYLLSLGIQPVITLLHFDTPAALQDAYGGFLSDKIVADFVNYAKTIFDRFSSKVKYFNTINEPDMYCKMHATLGQRSNKVLPLHNVDAAEAPYKCSKNALMAHAKAVELFRNSVQTKYKDRKIGYKDAGQFAAPLSNSVEDYQAANRSQEFMGWFAKPIFVDGDWPQAMKDTLGKSLPDITADEKSIIQGSADFLGWDGYFGVLASPPEGGVEKCVKDKKNPLWPNCVQTNNVTKDGYSIGVAGDKTLPFFITPDLFKQGLKHLDTAYKPKDGLIIGEFGFPVSGEQDMKLPNILYDQPRADYYQTYMTALLGAVNEDNVNVAGAFAWAATDDFEWFGGEATKLGLQYVNYKTFEREYKKSAFVFADFFKQHVMAGSGPGTNTGSVEANSANASSPATSGVENPSATDTGQVPAQQTPLPGSAQATPAVTAAPSETIQANQAARKKGSHTSSVTENSTTSIDSSTSASKTKSKTKAKSKQTSESKAPKTTTAEPTSTETSQEPNEFILETSSAAAVQPIEKAAVPEVPEATTPPGVAPPPPAAKPAAV